jgi:hypothetical protein
LYTFWPVAIAVAAAAESVIFDTVFGLAVAEDSFAAAPDFVSADFLAAVLDLVSAGAFVAAPDFVSAGALAAVLDFASVEPFAAAGDFSVAGHWTPGGGTA